MRNVPCRVISQGSPKCRYLPNTSIWDPYWLYYERNKLNHSRDIKYIIWWTKNYLGTPFLKSYRYMYLKSPCRKYKTTSSWGKVQKFMWEQDCWCLLLSGSEYLFYQVACPLLVLILKQKKLLKSTLFVHLSNDMLFLWFSGSSAWQSA